MEFSRRAGVQSRRFFLEAGKAESQWTRPPRVPPIVRSDHGFIDAFRRFVQRLLTPLLNQSYFTTCSGTRVRDVNGL